MPQVRALKQPNAVLRGDRPTPLPHGVIHDALDLMFRLLAVSDLDVEVNIGIADVPKRHGLRIRPGSANGVLAVLDETVDIADRYADVEFHVRPKDLRKSRGSVAYAPKRRSVRL